MGRPAGDRAQADGRRVYPAVERGRFGGGRITSLDRERSLPTAIALQAGEADQLTAPGWILAHSLHTIPRSSLRDFAGEVREDRMAEVEGCPRLDVRPRLRGQARRLRRPGRCSHDVRVRSPAGMGANTKSSSATPTDRCCSDPSASGSRTSSARPRVRSVVITNSLSTLRASPRRWRSPRGPQSVGGCLLSSRVASTRTSGGG